MTCEHRNYRAQVNVTNLEDTGARLAEITIKCDNCGLPFEFVGLPVGCEFYRPTTDLSAQILTAPIVPEGAKQVDGLIGYSLKIFKEGDEE